jgi:hypothetical protein
VTFIHINHFWLKIAAQGTYPPESEPFPAYPNPAIDTAIHRYVRRGGGL